MIGYTILIAVIVVASAFGLYRAKRQRQAREQIQRQQFEEAYLEEQRQRMRADRVLFMKDIERITKERHPESTRHQRRAVAAQYKQKIKSS